VRIRQFTDEVPEQAAVALAGMLGSGQAQGVVLDLRGNTGGTLRAVATLAGFFVEPGRPIGLEVDREKRSSPLYAEGTPLLPVPPMAMLVDGGTGSGAEILAAALSEYRLATLVGEQTAGSVAVGQVQNLSDGSQVQITVHRFVSPSGAQIDRVGVKPDEVVQLTPQHLGAGEDPQLQRALEIVERQISG
jgi:carboxyl-terminal processing protease